MIGIREGTISEYYVCHFRMATFHTCINFFYLCLLSCFVDTSTSEVNIRTS